MRLSFRKKLSYFFVRVTHFEYWPFWLFYFPIYFYGLYLAFRARSFMYFSTTNPAMKYGGVIGESKSKVLSWIPEAFKPKSLYFGHSTPVFKVLEYISQNAVEFPFIIKPDVGERGKHVELIKDESALHNYLTYRKQAFIVQEYIDSELELGIMYYRMPGAEGGQVTSVTQKGFLTVTGDGFSKLEDLILNEIRAQGRLDYLMEKFKGELDVVVPKGEKKHLEPIGNHCRGTTFYNANHLINPNLNLVIDKIASEIQGFYYGRFDLKVETLEDLYTGTNIKILELNGVSSEIAHIYDPDYKLVQAYRNIIHHMNIMAKIAKKNHEFGKEYAPLIKFLKDLAGHLSG